MARHGPGLRDDKLVIYRINFYKNAKLFILI